MRLVPLALALAAVLVAGCGSNTNPTPPANRAVAETTKTPTAAPAMTHTQFVQALNASCSKDKPAQDRLTRRFESALERGSLPQAGRVYSTMLKKVAEHTKRAEALKPPTSDRSAFRRYLAAQHRIQGLGARIARAMQDDDGAQVSRLSEPFNRERDRRLTAAVDLGADRCGG